MLTWKELTAIDRERLLRLTLVGFAAGTLIIAPKLWMPAGECPWIPLVPGLPQLPSGLNIALFVVQLGLLLAIAVLPNPRKLMTAFAILTFAICLFDETRLEPEIYLFTILFLALGIEGGLNVCRMIVACAYFWLGAQKLGISFPADLAWVLQPFGIPEKILAIMAPVAPFVEIAIGIGLCFVRTRVFAIALGVGMHLTILAALGPFGHDTDVIVWPWNFAMIGLLLVLFWRVPVSAREFMIPRSTLAKGVFVAVGILPVVGFLGYFDDYLSFHAYSGHFRRARYAVTERGKEASPESVKKWIKPGPDGSLTFRANPWMIQCKDAALHPSEQTFLEVLDYLCKSAADPKDFSVSIFRTGRLSGEKVILEERSCAPK